jgi:hypothetical protein
VRTGTAVLSRLGWWGSQTTECITHHQDTTTLPYHLGAAALARRADNVVGARRPHLAHVVFAYLVLLFVVLDL